MKNDKVRIALVGAGNWGRQHARILAAHPGVEFCGILGRTEQKVQERSREYGVRGYTRLSQMVEREKPDMVCVCLPSQEHYDLTLEIIRAGIPLLVEKPLVFDRREADTLLTEAGRRNLFFAINFNHRYAKPAELARQAISDGRVGDIVFATWRSSGQGSSTHRYANLIQTQCHAFDLLEQFCGPIESMMAQMTDKTGGGFRSLALALRFQNGAVGNLLGSYDSSWSYQNSHLLEIHGTKGRVLLEDTVRRFSFQAAGSETAEVWQAGYFNDFDREFHRMFDKHFDAMLSAFKAGQQPPIPAAAGHRALVCATAAIESFETGRRVSVPLL